MIDDRHIFLWVINTSISHYAELAHRATPPRNSTSCMSEFSTIMWIKLSHFFTAVSFLTLLLLMRNMPVSAIYVSLCKWGSNDEKFQLESSLLGHPVYWHTRAMQLSRVPREREVYTTLLLLYSTSRDLSSRWPRWWTENLNKILAIK